MRRWALLVAALAALAVALAGCGGGERDAAEAPVDPGETPAPPGVSPDGPVSVPIDDVAGIASGQVTLASAGPQRTDLAVALDGPPGAAFSASIREGACDALGELVHDLGVVEAGTTQLVADAPLQGLLSQQRAFVVAAAEEDVVACGDLPHRVG